MIRLIKLIIWIAVIWWWIFYYNYSSFKSEKLLEENEKIVIETWESFRILSEKISWLDSLYLKIYLKYNEPDFNLQAWSYNLENNLTISEILENFKNPINEVDIKLTFLEWWNIFDIDEYLESKGLIINWGFIKQVENINPDIFKEFSFLPSNISTLEWFLYPDTYNINPNNFSVDSLIKKMLNTFEIKVYNKLLSSKSDKEIIDTIILASIVEKEEKNSINKPVVAGILKKRLEQGWMIWADITVCYPHRLTWEECKMVVSKYINEKSDYNTRTMTWLPITPIWNPNFETIDATINSKKTSYFFYLHDNKWNIYYAETNWGHERNKNNYLK